MGADEIPESVLAQMATDFSAREQPSKKRTPMLLLVAFLAIVGVGGCLLWRPRTKIHDPKAYPRVTGSGGIPGWILKQDEEEKKKRAKEKEEWGKLMEQR